MKDSVYDECYGGNVIVLDKIIDAKKIDKKIKEAIDQFIDDNNEVHIVIVGTTYNIVQRPIIRPDPFIKTATPFVYNPHDNLYQKKRKQTRSYEGADC